VRCAASAATRAAGAPGCGWAVVAAARAAARAVAGRRNQGDASTLVREGLDDGIVPKHIALIMDGNRRYGRREHGAAIEGHRAGGEKLRDFVVWCSEAGVAVLTAFAFSTENWKRQPHEVDAMMELFLSEVPKLGECTEKLNARVRFLCSEPEPIPVRVRSAMDGLEARTSTCDGLQVNICLSYGGRGDVVQACRELSRDVIAGNLQVDAINETALSRRLLTGDMPDPDVLIRTSGELRLSNFLIFQLAYTELFFLDKHWPDVTREDFLEVIEEYRKRGRRFGK